MIDLVLCVHLLLEHTILNPYFFLVSTFALDLMPSFVERVNGPEDFERIKNKATKYGLPMMLVFSQGQRIMNEMKYLSTEFRRRVLILHIPFTKKENKNLFFEYGVRGQALLAVPPADGDDQEGSSGGNREIVFDGKWSLHRLQTFFSEHALKSEVKPQPKPADKETTEGKGDQEPGTTKKDGVKTEL